MLDERSLTKGEDNKKEKYVKGMKKSFSDFKSRYGDDAKSVMYATATKMAKEDVVDEGIGLEVARAIDKTKPPLGRSSKRRKVSDALKMREVSKTVAKNKKRKMAKEENIDEVLGGRPGDGYLGHPNLGIKNPLAKTQTKAPVTQGTKLPKGPNVNTVGARWGDRNAELLKYRQNLPSQMRNSYEPEGESIDEIAPLAVGAAVAGLAAAPYLAKKFLKPKADKALQRGRNELHLQGNPIGAGARGLGDSYEPEGEPIEEIAPVVAGALAVGKMAAKGALKKGVQAAGKKVAAGAVKGSVKTSSVKLGSVASKSKPVGKTATPQSSSVVKSDGGMQSKKAPSVPKKSDTPQEPKKPETSQEPTKSKEPGKKKKNGVEDGVKKGYAKVKDKVTGFTAMFDPKESYDQNSELLTFSDFREIVSICVSDEEELSEGKKIKKILGPKPVKGNPSEYIKDTNMMPGSGITKKYAEEFQNEGAAWTKKSGKNSEGGLNEKGRKSYEKANPGSDLKAPTKKVGNPRRASFCARMSGMKKKLTSKKTANDPDSRINKSLRKWNC